MLLASLGLLASCSNDNLEGPNPNVGTKGDAYFSLKVVENQGVRTTTPNTNDPEGATGDEATIKNVTLLLVNGSNSPFVITSSSFANGVATFKVAKSDFGKLASEMKMYAICNIPQGKSYSDFTTASDIQKVVKYDNDDQTYWNSTNGFLMSSAEEATSNPIDLIGINGGKYQDGKEVFDLGKVTVQRAMARLDLNGSQPEADENFDVEGINITFDGVSIVNISKEFNLFKSVDGKLFESETATNYVDDPKTEWNANTLHNYVNGSTAVADLYKAKGMAWPTATDDYETLRYTTPNTVTAKEQQKNGKSTGLIFKALIEAEDDLNTDDGEDLLFYYGTLVGGHKYITNTLKNGTAEQKTIANVYEKALGTNALKSDAARTALRNAGFEVYPADDEGNYYCYYNYWIRHNGIGTFGDGQMHPMEFGVVRNNIYKITVNSYKKLGNPADIKPNPNTDDDPPTTPGSVDNANLKVTVEVLPWEVREDKIEF